MPLLFQKFQAAFRNRTTYKVGLLQAKAYRALNQSTTLALEKFHISTIDWALLGLLYGSKDGMIQSEIADELGVERPFITNLSKKLASNKLIQTEISKEDNRIKYTSLTPSGRMFVEEVEKHLRSTATNVILKGVTMTEIATYLLVLEKIIENNTKID